MSSVKLFEEKKVRSQWNDQEEKWYFSIVDVVEILTASPNARKYWSVLKTRLKAEGSQLATNCSQLKMQSADGKFYKTDVADRKPFYPANYLWSHRRWKYDWKEEYGEAMN
jgi:hypothetical protein